MSRSSYVYIMANYKNGTLYIGVTTDLIGRVYQHKNNLVPGFTARHHCYKLVYFEIFDSIEEAILREKRIKKWNREWKIKLIEKDNPDWQDLYNDL